MFKKVHIFTFFRILEAIQKYQLDIINKKELKDSHNDAIKLIEACTPAIKETGLLKFVLLWKIVAAVQIIGIPPKNSDAVKHYELISNSMRDFVGTVLNDSDTEPYEYGIIIT